MTGPVCILQFGTNYWLWLIDSHGLQTLSKAYQVLLAHINLLICIQRLQTYRLDVQPVPKYFQMWDSQATLHGSMISHGGHAKIRCLQLHTQAKNCQRLER